MNTGMLENPITQDNIATLEKYGFTVIPSESGVLACKDVGSGRLPKEDVLIEYILHTIARPKDLAGVRVTVTAGPTQEALDPVRYLTNHSTGKMGYAVARAAAMRGAEVTLIHGPTALQPVRFTEDVPITTAQQMYEAVTSRFDEMDVLVMAAAVADYRPAAVADCIRLRSRTDIASFDIADDNETLFLAVGNGLLIRCHSRNAELLIHGNLRFYSRNQIVCCVDNRFIELPNGLCSSFECLSVLGKCLFLYVLRHIVQHRVQTYDDRCICFFNVCNQFVNHLLTLPLLFFLIEITQLRIQSCRRIR